MLKIKLKKLFCYIGAVLSLGNFWTLTSCSYLIGIKDNNTDESTQNIRDLLKKYKKENNKNFFLNEKQIDKLNDEAEKIISKHYNKWNITNKGFYGPLYIENGNEKRIELINKQNKIFISLKDVETIIEKKQIIIKNEKEYKKYFPNYKFNNNLTEFFKTHNVIAFYLLRADVLFNSINHIYPKKTGDKIEIFRFNLKDINLHTPITANIGQDYIYFFPYEKKYEIDFKNNELKTLESIEYLYKINEENEQQN
ncbi:hypothetical protein [[Mycoplasma] collis]|uniref:hypothetical protein n=1 Tax=[Mycoplasma] collis TaxID=2127 RepID=UPI00051BF1A8|nr:hypothetical protein [[Mycoplasma] collis]